MEKLLIFRIIRVLKLCSDFVFYDYRNPLFRQKIEFIFILKKGHSSKRHVQQNHVEKVYYKPIN